MTDPINRENDPRWAVLGAYVRDVANRMGLQQWYLTVSRKPPNDTPDPDPEHPTIAATFTCFQSIEATLHFADYFFSAPLDKQRLTVIHELIHVIGGGTLAAWNKIREFTPRQLDEWYITEEERFVDWLSSIIAPSMPLIDWTADADNPPRV